MPSVPVLRSHDRKAQRLRPHDMRYVMTLESGDRPVLTALLIAVWRAEV